jgi:hypothetical protein
MDPTTSTPPDKQRADTRQHYTGVEFNFEFSKDQGVCPLCMGRMVLERDHDGFLSRTCGSCDSFSGLPLIDAVYRMNADMQIRGGCVDTLEGVDPVEISGKLVDRNRERWTEGYDER